MKLFTLIIVFLSFFSITCYGQGNISSNNKLVSKVYDITEVHPSFPGGNDSLNNFIKKNLKHPSGSLCCEGAIFVSFIVNEDGTLSDHKVVKGGCGDYDKCAIDVFKNMPIWNPGKQNDKAVKVRCVYPVRFSIS